MSLDGKATIRLQREFARHVRDPERFLPPAGLEERRLKIYRELFFNNIESLLATNFPVLRDCLGESHWKHLVRDFYRDHVSITPLFTEVGREFVRFLEGLDENTCETAPVFAELAHYEWVELALSLDERRLDELPHDPSGDVLTGMPIRSPLAWCFSYRWPVHRLGGQFDVHTIQPRPTHLLIVRDRHDEISFIELAPLAKLIFDQIGAQRGMSGVALCEALADAMPQFPRERIVREVQQCLRDFRERDILLGTVITP